jgi:hypothetical protein
VYLPRELAEKGYHENNRGYGLSMMGTPFTWVGLKGYKFWTWESGYFDFFSICVLFLIRERTLADT